MKVEARTLFEDSFRRRRHTEFEVAICLSNSDQRIEKGVGAHDVPAWPVFLNKRGFREACGEIVFYAMSLDAGGFLHDPAHTPMFFSGRSIPVLRKTPSEIFRFSDVDQIVCLVVDKVHA